MVWVGNVTRMEMRKANEIFIGNVKRKVHFVRLCMYVYIYLCMYYLMTMSITCVTGKWRRLHNEELYDRYLSKIITWVTKSVHITQLNGLRIT